MNNLIDFLSSREAIIIYSCAIVICIILITYYYIVKGKDKRRQKQNTKELENFVEEIEREEQKIAQNNSINKELPVEKPVVVTDTDSLKTVDIVEELAKDNLEVVNGNVEATIEQSEAKENEIPSSESIPQQTLKTPKMEELSYAPIELNQDEARKELEKIAQELYAKEQEQKSQTEVLPQTEKEKASPVQVTVDEIIEPALESQELKHDEVVVEEIENSDLTNFEREQEANAIISLDELMQKASNIYEQNEKIQYQDEGNEPISLDDLQKRWAKEQQIVEEINNEIKIEELSDINSSTKTPLYEEKTPKKVVVSPITTELNRKEETNATFKSSPLISPVYGISKDEVEKPVDYKNNHELALENTANYEKFDAEIKKTNEFIAALKELQKKLD